MDIAKTVQNIGTTLDLRRIASAYVIDYRNLSDDEIRAAILKTAPQYYFRDNVAQALEGLFLGDNRDHRVISRLMLKTVLLQKDHFMCPQRETEEDIIAFEQAIINRSNEDLLQRSGERSKAIELFQFVLDTAWQHNASISPDEKNLIEKIKGRLKITDREYYLIEAKLGKYPKPGNELHTRGEIEEARKAMQGKGLLFAIRDSDGTDFDLVPEEIARGLRDVLGFQIRRHGYRELLTHKHVRAKRYYLNILDKCGVPVEGMASMEDLQEAILEQVPPSLLLGGISPRDGLDISVLRKWCAELGLPVSGVKADTIQRIIAHYDSILEKDDVLRDDREHWYEHYDRFASRDLEFLRSQQLIGKDLECEAKFEQATDYLFEKRLQHKPLKLIGTAHPDGALSFQDKVIYWDNKSKETQVNLRDHIRQFDSYIKSSERPVACFFVIGPAFTPESGVLAMQYFVENATTITLIKADDLKAIADDWSSPASGKEEDPFPLGYLIQPGELNRALVATV